MTSGTSASALPSKVDSELLAAYYGEFRTIARRIIGGSRERLTLQPTDLVHEAALRLLDSCGAWIRDETHLLALGARVIRMTLIDEIRKRHAGKRDVRVVTCWDEQNAPAVELDIETFDRLLDELAAFEPEGARIIELRFYVGLTMPEIARTLALSERTTHRRWQSARAWLLSELEAA